MVSRTAVSYLIIVLITTCIIANGQNVTRGPYLQTPTPWSIKIKWRTDQATNSRVYYGASPNSLTDSVDVPGSVTDHTVQLNNLSPFTKYYYAIGTYSQTLSGPDSLHHFTTNPVPGSVQPIRIWAIGDFGKGNAGQISVMNSYLNYTGNNHTDVWLWLGDNAYNDGTDAEYQTKVFDIYEDIMKYIPFWPSPGNHDYNSVNRLSAPPTHTGPYYDIVDVPIAGEAGGVPSGYELYYSYDYGNVHLISLNSELQDWTGALSLGSFSSSPMSDWLENDLQTTNKPWVIVYFHQPPYTKGSHDSDDFWELYMTAMRENFNPIIEQYGVDVVLCGHSHVYERSYLLNGHYGNSSTFNNSNKVDGSSGKDDLGEAYIKYLDGPNPNYGTVYVVCGNGGSDASSPSLNHPAMYFGDGGSNVHGSFVIDVNGNRLDGKYLKSNGSVQDHFTILKTTINVTNNVEVNICAGESYFAGGVDQTTSGTYYDTIPVVGGPDTVIITDLVVENIDTSNILVSICNGASYFAGGAWQTTSGTYTDIFAASSGCDSVVVTDLEVRAVITEQVNVEVCAGDSFYAGGDFQTTPGVYLDSLTASGGCDSIVTTNLSFQPPQSETLEVEICEGETYFAGGADRDSAGIYYDTLTASMGCDSILTTLLQVNASPQEPSLVIEGNLLSVDSGFANYQWYQDNDPVPGANGYFLLADEDGAYQVLVYDENGCSTASNVEDIVVLGVKEQIISSAPQIYPNPTQSSIYIALNEYAGKVDHAEIVNILGQPVIIINPTMLVRGTLDVDISGLDAGVYLLRLNVGEKAVSIKLVKN